MFQPFRHKKMKRKKGVRSTRPVTRRIFSIKTNQLNEIDAFLKVN